jgi:DNA-binding SARP family transcriptional activator/type II secretory pathway predicted ATPase ExeA
MDSQRFLRCLGQPVLFGPGGEPIRFRTRKHLALLVFIAVEARSHRRDRLAELLWPNVSATEARHSLATALSILRPRLGLDGLETSRDHVRLLPGRVVLDLERLQSGDVLGSEITGPLEVAAFLDGFDITDSTEFTHWKDRQQGRLLPVIKDALLVLIDRCRRTGNTRQIEQLADRMLALDELSEEAIRAKMEARAFAGDRLTALEIFEAWKKKLAEELQAAPSELVEGMAVRLRRRGWERTTLANIPTVPTDQWRGRPFIGRTAEYRILYELWEGVRRGVPGHALVLGDSGVGKTTLVQRLTTAAGLEGAAISRVQCYDLEREIPYSTLSSLILGLLDRPGVSATSPESLAEISRAVPQIRNRFPHLPTRSDSQGETARIKLTAAFHEMLTAISEEHPVILVVDDLHVADDVSLAVLHLVLRRARGQQIMLVLIARSSELSQSAQAAALRESAHNFSLCEIDLLPLAENESRQMLQSMITPDDAHPNIGEQRALLRAAAGYPMVLELLVEDWKKSREHSLALSFDAMTADLDTDGRAYMVYQQILARITRSLDSTTQSVLNLASMLGHRLNDLSMYTLVDLTPGQTMTGMAELVKRRVFRDGAQGLEFINELLRAAVYVSLPQTLRRVLHSEIADRFIQQHARGRTDLGLEIAWHCIRAGRVSEGTCHLLQGARNSVDKGALQSAERALSTAIPHLQGTERSAAILLLVEVLQEQGRWRDSLNILSETASEHSREAYVTYSISARHWSIGSCPEEVYGELDRLRAVVEGNVEPRLRVKAAKIGASLISDLRDSHLAKALLESVRTIPTPSGIDDVARLADCKAQLLYYAFEPGSCLKEIVQVADQLRDERLLNSTIASLHNGLGVLACVEGRYPQAKAEFRRSYDISICLGNDSIAGSRAAQVALSCYRLGEYEEAIRWSATASENFAYVPFAGYPECQAARHIGSCNALLGNREQAVNTITELESRMPPSSPAWMKQAWGLHKADVLLYLGSRQEACSVARQALGEPGPRLHNWGFAGAFARWLAITSKDTCFEDVGRSQIRHLADELEKFDAVDRVEILCARLLLEYEPGNPPSDLVGEIKERLSKLPHAITEQLFRLELLDARLAFSKCLTLAN